MSDKTICAKCKKPYKTYVIFLCDRIECFVMDQHIRDLYYHSKEDSELYKDNQGLCEPCRKKMEQDNIWKAQEWFSVELQLECAVMNMEKKKDKSDSIKKFKEAIQRVQAIIKKAEEDPKVQAMYRKNNPAAYKKPPKTKTKCAYCGENDGQKWINNPNEDWTSYNCWWVCIPCEKVMELQQQDAFLGHFHHHIKDITPELAEKVKKQRDEVQKKIDEVAYEDGQEAFSIEITKK